MVNNNLIKMKVEVEIKQDFLDNLSMYKEDKEREQAEKKRIEEEMRK